MPAAVDLQPVSAIFFLFLHMQGNTSKNCVHYVGELGFYLNFDLAQVPKLIEALKQEQTLFRDLRL